MAVLSSNSLFTSWDMSPTEVLQSCVLSGLQKQHIQNLIAAYAAEKIQREIDPINPIITIKADAMSAGQISALQYLLDLSVQAEQALRQSPEPDPAHGY